MHSIYIITFKHIESDSTAKGRRKTDDLNIESDIESWHARSTPERSVPGIMELYNAISRKVLFNYLAKHILAPLSVKA